MKRGIIAFAAVAAMSVGIASVQAADVHPGWFNGSGTANGEFTVNSSSGVELGLRAKYRHNASLITPVGDTYTVVAGPETAATSGGPTSSYAAWNYEFSISSALALSNYTTRLEITDPNGNSMFVDPLSYWADNTDQTGSAFDPSVDTTAQNSENPAFGDFPLASSYNLWKTGKYTFTLSVASIGGPVFASDTINVNVVPVPLPKAAYAGLGLIAGLGLLGGLKRRQRRLA